MSLLGAGALGRTEDSLPPDVVYFFLKVHNKKMVDKIKWVREIIIKNN